MNGLNRYGLVIVIILMIPNIIFLFKENHFETPYKNHVVEFIEQVGRFASIGLMIFNIGLLEYGYWFTGGKILYEGLTFILAMLYCLIWAWYFKNKSIKKAMLLAMIPTLIFLSSGVIQGKVLLILSSILFGIAHVIITYYNNR